MSKAKRRFSFAAAVLGAAFLAAAQSGTADLSEMKKKPMGLYKNVFDQNVYYEGTNLLRLDRLYRKLFRKKLRSVNVNVYDEVPDSDFFTNRHGRKRMTAEALARGYRENDGPDLSGTIRIVSGKFEGVHPGFFVEDSKGDRYLIKFDPADYLELVTSAEIVGSRFYHAIGYNVPQYTIATFAPDKLVPDGEAEVVDNTGFKKKLTKEKLEEFLLFIPWDAEGRFRASASKLLGGENKGSLPLTGRRKDDPLDTVNHENLREIRGLQVFSAWLNNYDVRDHNALDMLVTENGRTFIKHYIIDFNGALGADKGGPKPPSFGHEHTYDFGEVTKAVVGLGFWEKTWLKRWKANGEKVNDSPAIGYFDNKYFDPGKWKEQLPIYAFKDITRADGFWAAKIVMKFTDEDIRAVVKEGQYSNPDDEAYIAQTLIERRDIVGRYWFSQANPLDSFNLEAQKLVFEDLAVKYGFEKAADTVYHADVIAKEGGRGKKLASLQSKDTAIPLDQSWLSEEGVDVLIRTSRAGKEPGAYVLVELNKQGVAGILHQD